MTSNEGLGPDHLESSDDEAERRRMRRWFWALGILAGFAFLGSLRYHYPVVHTAAGTDYQVTFRGRQRGAHGAWTELDYLTQSNSIDKTLAEIQEVFPLAEQLAKQQGDSIIKVKAIDRLIEFGLFHVDRFTMVQFYRRGDGWRTF